MRTAQAFPFLGACEKRTDRSHFDNRVFCTACTLVLIAALSAAGCRSRAHRDVYHDRMAGEIRVLEDQLYEADYQNRVLRDKLERCGECDSAPHSFRLSTDPPLIESAPSPIPPPSTDPSGGQVENPGSFSDVGQTPEPDPDVDSLRNDPPTPIVPSVGDGAGTGNGDNEPTPLTDPPAAENDAGPNDAGPTDGAPGMVIPEGTDPGEETGTDPGTTTPGAGESTEPRANGESGGGFSLPLGDPPVGGSVEDLPPPTNNFPPAGNNPAGDNPAGTDSGPSPIIDSEVVPPGPAVEDPGEGVPIPKGSDILQHTPSAPPLPPLVLPVPERLGLHQQLSGGHQLDQDADVDGMFLVINALDSEDDIVDLTQFDVDASMTVIAVDPKSESSDQRIGRWDFDPDQVRKMIRREPVDGLHLSVAWQGVEPTGDQVIIHIRLKAAEQEMRCQAKLKLSKTVAMSNWLPRGDYK